MPAVPFAQVQASIDGGANVSGGITATLGQTCQLSGVSTSQWTSQLWEIYEYPTGFALPADWTYVGGSYQSAAVTPPIFTMTPWGKYFFRLTVNTGLLNGVLAPSGSVQPLIDTTTAISILSPSGLIDVGANETNQFDAMRQWMAAIKADLRVIAAGVATSLSGAVTIAAGVVTTTSPGGSGTETCEMADLVTTDAADQILASFALAAGTMTLLDVEVVAIRQDETVGAWWKKSIAFLTDAGGSVTAGTQHDIDVEMIGGAPAWTLALDNSTTTARVVVNGAGDAVTWTVKHARLRVAAT